MVRLFVDGLGFTTLLFLVFWLLLLRFLLTRVLDDEFGEILSLLQFSGFEINDLSRLVIVVRFPVDGAQL